MRRVFVLAHFCALGALGAAVVFIIMSLNDQYVFGRLEVQTSPCGGLSSLFENPECRNVFALTDESGELSDRSRFIKKAAIFSLLLFVAAVHVFSIVFVLKRLKRSTSHAGLKA
ncbi:MAG: hypothetical protein ACREQW_15965 [Candidatus Binatia bacterium]